MQDYIAAGLPPGRFWKITPRLFDLELRGAARRLDREHNLAAFVAWHAAYLPMMKRTVRLSDLMVGQVKPPPVSWEDQLAAWESYAARH